MGRGSSGSTGRAGGGGGNNNVYVRKGRTIYSISKSEDGKTFYLNISNVDDSGLKQKLKISYANNPEKARVDLGRMGYVYLKEDPAVLKLLNNAKAKKTSTTRKKTK